jgi:hypothetical protein
MRRRSGRNDIWPAGLATEAEVAIGASQPQQLSPSGRFAAFSDVRYKNYQPEEHVWAKDLQSGEEKELFMLPARTVPSSEPNVTLNVVGWVEKK